MRVAIDYTPAARKRTGIGNNIFYLVESLHKIDPENYYYLCIHRLSYLYGRLKNKHISLKEFNTDRFRYVPFTNARALSYFMKRKIDIAHNTNFKILCSGSRGTLTTVHDIAFLLFPDFVPPELMPKYTARTKNAIEKSDIVITVSKSSADDICKFLHIPQDKIKVVYNGVNRTLFKKAEHDASFETFRRKYNIDRKYVLFVGTLEKRKNVVNLVKAFKGINKDYLLVLIGKPGWKSEEILEAIESMDLSKDVRMIGYVQDNELPLFYSNAELFVYPSLYEGFGMPPVEAMSCGAPVMVSDIPVFREILQDAAAYVNPYDIAEIHDKLIYSLQNESERERLRHSGLKLSEKYTWERSAGALLNIYKELYK